MPGTGLPRRATSRTRSSTGASVDSSQVMTRPTSLSAPPTMDSEAETRYAHSPVGRTSGVPGTMTRMAPEVAADSATVPASVAPTPRFEA